MIPTIVVLRIDGHGTEHLSLHASRQQALRRLVEVGGRAWYDRFGYWLAAAVDHSPEPEVLSDRLAGEGWRVRIEEQEVEL